MLAQAATTIGLLALVSLLSRAAVDTPSQLEVHARDMVERALHLMESAESAESQARRARHLGAAEALLETARMLSSDRSLERATNVSVSTAVRRVHSRIQKLEAPSEGQSRAVDRRRGATA